MLKVVFAAFLLLSLFILLFSIDRKDRMQRRRHKINRNRRHFISFSATLAQNEGLRAVNDKVGVTVAAVTGRRNPKTTTPLIPAGGWDVGEYSKLCNSCMACVTACPEHILEPSLKPGRAMLPVMNFRAGWCKTDCTRCSEVCSTGALRPITPAEKSSVQIGHAVWIRENCLSVSGSTCNACEEACPNGCIQMITNGRKVYPIVNASRCLGCGACENACPASPLKAVYVEGFGLHRQF